MLTNLFCTVIMCGIAVLGDFMVLQFGHAYLLSALVDNGTHAIIGGLSWCIVCFQRKISSNLSEIIWQTLLCTLVASLTDADHFIEAKSLKLEDVHLLTHRPFMHNTTLALGISMILICLSHFVWLWGHTLGWILIAAFISHHTRDAMRRGYWFPPLGSTAPIHHWLYIAITAGLPYIINILFTISKPHRDIRKIINVDEYSMV